MLGPPHYISIYHYCLQRYQHLKQQWEMKSEEAELLQTKIQQSAYHKQQEDLLALKKTIGETKVFFILQLKVNCRERYLAVEKQTAKGKNSFENICFIFWSISQNHSWQTQVWGSDKVFHALLKALSLLRIPHTYFRVKGRMVL